MEPDLITDAKLQSVLAELIRREPIFHRPEFGTSRRDFDTMMDAGFWEVGASGRRYSRKYVLDVLTKRHETPIEDLWETEGFHCRELGPNIYLLTYTLKQGERVTRRATIWRKTADDWKIVFHQGTLVQDE
jgi:hypothetical protein